MSVRRSLILVCVIAALHGLFFIWYQRPGWKTQWSDQDGYRRLGQVLAETGRFTRYPDAPRFVPEVIRTPGYPMFVAVVYRLAGPHQLAVALAQTALFVLLCLVVYALARSVASGSIAVRAAALTALFPPLPYFAALVLTELWTTFLVTLGVWLAFRARRRELTRDAVLSGIVLGLAALSRPAFVWLPFLLLAVASILWRRRTLRWSLGIVAAALTLAPWFAYNYVNLHQLTLSPAGGLGRAIWEGSWQGRWNGRVHSELTHTAERFDDPRALDEAVRRIARDADADPDPMLTYVHQWQAIRRMWDTPTDPDERTRARMAADIEYLRVGLANARANPIAHLWRRLTVGLFVLWAAEIPIRYSDINSVPVWIIRLCWAIQVALIVLAVVGFASLARRGRWRDTIVLALPILYITAIHVPLLTESRQSLPGMPVLLVLAAAGASAVCDRVMRRRGDARSAVPA